MASFFSTLKRQLELAMIPGFVAPLCMKNAYNLVTLGN